MRHFIRILVGHACWLAVQLSAHGFVADTIVHNFGSKPATIQQLCDQICCGKQQFVSSWHEKKGTWCSQQIRRVGRGTINCTITLKFDDDPEHDVTCSPMQLFYNTECGQWIEAYKLRVDDMLCTESGNTIQLAGLCVHEEESVVYALRVRKNHTFCVGYYRVLTHNKHFPLIPLAIMARIGVAFGTGAAAGGAASGWLGPITCVGGFTIGGVVGALVTCATISHELYRYRVQINTGDIERALSSSNVHPSQAIEAPSRGGAHVYPAELPERIENRGCGYTDQSAFIATGCGRTPQHLVIPALPIGCGGKPAELENRVTVIGCFPDLVVSAFAQESGQEITPKKTIEDLAKECKPGKETKGKSRQYEKDGGFEQAEQDFETLGPSNVRPIPTGKAGTLPDGRTVNVRTESSFETPTLEVLNKKTGRKIKIRYIDSK